MDGASTASRARSIPRVRGIPLLGSLPSLLYGQLGFLERAFEQHGPIFELDLGLTRAVVIADVAAAEEVLIGKARSFDKGGDFWDGLRDVLGLGLAMSEGELWRRQRSLMQPEFNRSQIEGYRGVITETIEGALGGLDAAGPIDIAQWSDQLLAALTVRLLFGSTADASRIDELRRVMAELFDMVLAGLVTRRVPRWIPMPGRRRFEVARNTLDALVMALIEERRRDPKAGHDLLSVLLGATDESGSMSDRQLRDEAVTFYVAGYETTGTTLAWTLWLLASHPELRDRIQAELGQPEAPLLRACVQEGLRLYPAAPLIPRRAVTAETIGGVAIEAGTTVVVAPWLLHRDPRSWPRPGAFDPSRFIGDAGRGRPRFAWIPFGAGQRTCIGKALALLELELALRLILERFTPTVAMGRPPPKTRLSTTLRSKAGIFLEMRPAPSRSGRGSVDQRTEISQ